MAVSNPQLVAAEWALGPPPDSQSASYFSVAPCAGTLAPGQSAFVQVWEPLAKFFIPQLALLQIRDPSP